MENKLKSQRKKDPAETTTTQTQRISVQFPKMKLENLSSVDVFQRKTNIDHSKQILAIEIPF